VTLTTQPLAGKGWSRATGKVTVIGTLPDDGAFYELVPWAESQMVQRGRSIADEHLPTP